MARIQRKTKLMSRAMKLALIVMVFILAYQIFNSIYYTLMNASHTQEVRKDKMQFISNSMSDDINDVRNTINQLLDQESVQKIKYNKSIDEYPYETKRQLIELLKVARLSSNVNYNYYIMFTLSNYTFSSSGTLYNNVLIKTITSIYPKIAAIPEDRKFYLISGAINPAEEQTSLISNLIVYKEKYLTIIAVSNQEHENSILRGLLSEDNSIAVVMDEHGTILANSDHIALPKSYDGIKVYMSQLNQSENGKIYEFEHMQKDGLFYIIGFDRKSLTTLSQNYTYYIWITLVCCFVFIGIFFYMMNREIYSPIKSIINNLDISKVDRKTDEYHLIEMTIVDMNMRLGLLKKKLDDHDELNAESMLNKLAMGFDVIDNKLPVSARSGDAERYVILTAVFENESGGTNWAAADCFGNLLAEKCAVKVILRMGNQQSWYISANDVKIELEIDEIIVNPLLQGFVLAGMSKIHTDMSKIPDAFKQSCRFLTYPNISADQRNRTIYRVPNTDNSNDIMLNLNIQEENILINQSKKGDIGSVRQMLTNIIMNNRRLSIIHQRDLHIYLIHLLHTICTASDVVCFNETIKTIRETCNIHLMNDLVLNAYHIVAEKNAEDIDDLFDTIKDYIDKNYEKDIYLQKVADAVKLSYSYVSRYLKKKTGMCFVDFLGNLRIDKAKQLLLESNHSVGTIASLVGFESGNTFIRTFKKITGVTPGEYRRVNSENKG